MMILIQNNSPVQFFKSLNDILCILKVDFFFKKKTKLSVYFPK